MTNRETDVGIRLYSNKGLRWELKALESGGTELIAAANEILGGIRERAKATKLKALEAKKKTPPLLVMEGKAVLSEPDPVKVGDRWIQHSTIHFVLDELGQLVFDRLKEDGCEPFVEFNVQSPTNAYFAIYISL